MLSFLTHQCASLNLIYGDDLFIKESPEYKNVTDTYWSEQQSSIEPTCIFAPGNTSEVASLVLLSRLTRCPFAVKGGGHAAFPNASNIDGGITVSMHKFDQVDVSDDKTAVNVGPGLRWVDVYERLEEHDVGVLGGRVRLP
jgi:FAD/FMN-containing dehydrogenase